MTTPAVPCSETDCRPRGGGQHDPWRYTRQAAERHDWVWDDMTDDEQYEAFKHWMDGGCLQCNPLLAP